MKLITNKSKNLLYRISSDSNTTVQFSTSYAVATQTIADTSSSLSFKLQGYKNSSQSYTGLFSGEVISSTGVFTKTFTTPSTTGFDLIRFGLNGAKYDTCANCNIDLKPNTTYTFTCNFTNITQGSISWKDMMLVEGSTVGEYEPYSYNLLDKWQYPATQTVKGVTFTNNGDGKWTISGKSTSDFAYYNLVPNLQLNQGHTYLAPYVDLMACYVEVKFKNKNDKVQWGVNRYTADENSKVDIGFIALDTFDGADTVLIPQLYDLTLMYGAGNEPTTVDQFYTDHPELKVSPLGFIGLKNLEISNKNIKRLRYATTTRNLFDKSRVIKGFELEGNRGGTVENLTWFVSDYISVVGISTLTISGKVSGGASNCFYDNNRNFISTVNMLNGTFQVPSGATYMRFNGLLTEIDTAQLESGSTATPYVPYGYLDLGIIPSNSGIH